MKKRQVAPAAARPAAGLDPASGQDEAVAVATRACRFCQAPVPQLHPGQVREFCDNRHRAAYRAQEQQRAIEAALAAWDEIADSLEQLGAKAAGARAMLQRFQKKARR